MKEDTEQHLYNLFMKLCQRNTETTLGKQFGHEKWYERRNTAMRYCQDIWNKKKDKIIPKLQEIKKKRVEDKQQTKITQFIEAKEIELTDEEIKEIEYLLEHNEEK